MLYAQYCLNLLSLTNNMFCGCTCGSDRAAVLKPGCTNETEVLPPRIQVDPPVKTVEVGDRASFSCRGSGDLIASIEWLDGQGRKIQTSRGELVISNARKSDQGTFTCVIENWLGMKVTDTGRLIVSGDEASDPCDDPRTGCSHSCRSQGDSYVCECPSGMDMGDDGKTCNPRDVCTRLRPCSHTCTSLPGGGYQCTCPSGYTLGRNKHTCIVQRVCDSLSPPCSHDCRETRRSPGYVCSCPRGMELGADQKTCVTIVVRPCQRNPCSHTCTENSRAPNGYVCSCPRGWELSSNSRTCVKEVVSPCQSNPCSNICTDNRRAPNGYVCSCPSGMILNNDGRTCGVSMCNRLRPCSHGCRDDTRSPDGYVCLCPAGMRLDRDRRTCREISVCDSLRPCTHTCIDDSRYPGGYVCRCPAGMALGRDGRTCEDRCSGLPCTHRCENTDTGYVCYCFSPPCGPDTRIDVCDRYKPCSDICTNVGNGYQCSCRPRRVLNPDRRTCKPRTDPLYVAVSPIVKRVDAGGSTSLTCSATGGTGRVTLSWTPNVRGGVFDGRTWTVTNANRADHEMKYTCTATDESGQRDSATAQLFIIESPTPSVSLRPKYKTIREGDAATLTCSVSQGTPRSISIGRVDGRALGFNVEARRTVYPGDTLVINNARPEDGGQYICRYVDAKHQVDDSATLVVTQIIEPKNTTVTCGSTVTLSCAVSEGGPVHSVSWKFNDADINSREVLVSGNSIILRNVGPDDEGLYTCEGRTIHSTTSTYTRLIVQCPPRIEVSVNSNSFKVGEQAILTCKVEGRPDVTLTTWSKEGQLLTSSRNGISDQRGNERLTLVHTLSSVSTGDAGRYRCYAENSVNSSFADVSLSVTPNPPVISVSGGGNVTQNRSVVLTCNIISGSQSRPLRYVWTYLGENRRTSMPYGVTPSSDRLRIPRVDFEHDGTYTCQVTDRFGQTSARATGTIYVTGGLIITPTTNITEGPDSVTLTCSVPPGTDIITWKREPDVDLPAHSDTLGRYDETLLISPVNAEDTGVYICCATNNRGSKSSCSAFPSPDAPPRVRITGYVATYFLNGRLDLRCEIVLPGSPAVTGVTWYKDNIPYTRARGNRIIISRLSPRDQGRYRCIARNRKGSDYDEKTISFTCAKPSDVDIIGGRDDEMYALGNTLLLKCESKGNPPPRMTWYKDGRPISSEGANLALNSITERTAGAYKCRATNNCGGNSIQEKTINIRIRDKAPTNPKITGPLGPFLPGNPLTFRCESTGGYPDPTITWWYQGARALSGSSDPSVLQFISAVERAGDYECRATNPRGTGRTTIEIKMLCNLPDPVITAPRVVAIGSNVTLVCSAPGAYPEPDFSWYKRGTSQSGHEVRIQMATPDWHDGSYACEVSNICGRKRTETEVTVAGEKPRVTIYGDALNPIFIGDSREFTCSATGEPSPRVQWRFNKRSVPSTNGVLRITDASIEDKGRYTCTATNQYDSDTERVDVNVVGIPPGGVVIRGDNQVRMGAQMQLTCEVIGQPPRPAAAITWYFKGQRMQTGDTLRMRSMDTSMVGTYECRASNGWGSDVTTTMNVGVMGERPPPPTITPGVDSELVYVRENSKNEWTCQTVPGARVFWKRVSNSYTPPNFVQGAKFRVREAALQDTDMYYCISENEMGPSPPSSNINITVIRRPGRVSIERTPAPNDQGQYDQDTSVTMICNVEGVSSSNVRTYWTKSGSSATISVNRELRLYGLPREAGVYTCRATYGDGTTIGQDQVTINIRNRQCPTAVTIDDVPNRGYVRQGSTHSLLCTSDAFPSPQYTWTRADGQPLRHRVSDNGILYLNAVTEQDMGVYVCRVDHVQCSHRTESQAIIMIEPPVITRYDPEGPNVTPRAGTTVTLICEADGVPNPSITWRYNGRSSLPAVARASAGGVLTITGMQTLYDGTYACVANHEFGPEATYEWYIVTSNLRAPRNVRIEKSSDQKLYYGKTGFRLTCVAEATEASYIWRKKVNGVYRDNVLPVNTRVINYGPMRSVLNFTSLQDQHSGEYQCEAFNAAGKDTSSTVRIEVDVGPKVEFPHCKSYGGIICIQSVSANTKHLLECSALGKPTLNYEWFTGNDLNDPIDSTQALEWSGQNGIQLTDSNDYICMVNRDWDDTTADYGLFRVYVAVQPTRFSEIASHAVCSVPSAADNDRLNIQVSIIPEGQNGLIYSYDGSNGVELRLSLSNRQPTLVIRQRGRRDVTVYTRQYIPSDVYTPIEVTMDSREVTVRVRVDGRYAVTRESISGSSFSVPTDGSISLFGEETDQRSGLIGGVSVLVMNGDLMDINSCRRFGLIKTEYSRCQSDTCGGDGVGTCVPARTLEGYYCYCATDGMPSMGCTAQGYSEPSSLTQNAFIMNHFEQIFGKRLDQFHPIIRIGDNYRVDYVGGSALNFTSVYTNGGGRYGGYGGYPIRTSYRGIGGGSVFTSGGSQSGDQYGGGYIGNLNQQRGGYTGQTGGGYVDRSGGYSGYSGQSGGGYVDRSGGSSGNNDQSGGSLGYPSGSGAGRSGGTVYSSGTRQVNSQSGSSGGTGGGFTSQAGSGSEWSEWSGVRTGSSSGQSGGSSSQSSRRYVGQSGGSSSQSGNRYTGQSGVSSGSGSGSRSGVQVGGGTVYSADNRQVYTTNARTGGDSSGSSRSSGQSGGVASSQSGAGPDYSYYVQSGGSQTGGSSNTPDLAGNGNVDQSGGSSISSQSSGQGGVSGGGSRTIIRTTSFNSTGGSSYYQPVVFRDSESGVISSSSSGSGARSQVGGQSGAGINSGQSGSSSQYQPVIFRNGEAYPSSQSGRDSRSTSGGQSSGGTSSSGQSYGQSSGGTSSGGPSSSDLSYVQSSGGPSSGGTYYGGISSGTRTDSTSYRISSSSSSSGTSDSGGYYQPVVFRSQGGDSLIPTRGDLYTSLQKDQPSRKPHKDDDAGPPPPPKQQPTPAPISPPSDGLSAGFSGKGYLALPRSFANWLRRGRASFEITTTSRDGLILYHGGKPDSTMADSEFVAVAVKDGAIELSYRLSRYLEPTKVRSSVRVDDGRPHTVSFHRNKGEATLKVDGVTVTGSHRSSYLAAAGDLYLGGVPELSMVEDLYTDFFNGCISNVKTSAYENNAREITLFEHMVKSSGASRTCER